MRRRKIGRRERKGSNKFLSTKKMPRERGGEQKREEVKIKYIKKVDKRRPL